ncbi:beta-propeller fold lactonase family protein [Brevibacterium sp.]|uniref:lactonase family protein n=1 Tax=Brevibacterium sp. TaxID=1701 RepID=UPI0025BBFD72|nr:beta-propeller fold lactonase family protein [Brevibacterium sp.]
MTSPANRRATDRLYVNAQSPGMAVVDLYDDGSAQLFPGSPFRTGSGCVDLRVTPNGKYLLAPADWGLPMGGGMRQTFKPEIGVYRVEDDGSVTEASTYRFDRLTTPLGTDTAANGRDVYVGMGRGLAGMLWGSIQHFRLSEDGVLSLAGPRRRRGKFSHGLVQPKISPDGTKIFVISAFSNTIFTYALEADGGIGGQIHELQVSGRTPVNPVYSPDKRFLFTANEGSSSIGVLEIGPNGLLTEIPTSPLPAGRAVHNPTFSRDGRYVWVGNPIDETISGYSLRENGELIALPGSPYPSPGAAMDFAQSSDGAWLFVTGSPVKARKWPVKLVSFRIREDGSLERLQHPAVPLGLTFQDGPTSISFPIAE